jgi:N-sulfoglucosamine sulfohydrolase
VESGHTSGHVFGALGRLLGGRVFDGLVSHLDIYPTLCELAGIAEPPWLQGTSLLPLVRGETAKVNDASSPR